MHHEHAVAKALHESEVMADEQQCEAAGALNVGKRLNDLRLNGYVEGAGCFVAYDELRFGDERAGDGSSLALPAAHLVGIPVCKARVEPALFERQECLGACLRLASARVAQRLLDAVAQRASGVEGADGVLEHHLQVGVQRALRRPSYVRDVLSIEPDFSRCAVRETCYHARGGALAAA